MGAFLIVAYVMVSMEGEVFCYVPADEVDGSWVGLETFLHLGGAEGEYVCLLGDMGRRIFRWSGERFLERSTDNAWVHTQLCTEVRSVLCK